MNVEMPPAQRRSIFAPGAAAAAMVLVAGAALSACTGDGHHGAPSSPPSAATSIPGTVVPSVTGATSVSASPTSTGPADFSYQPLYPFGSVGQAIDWQRQGGSGGHQPWHLDAGIIAQNFTQQYLGFSGVDKVVKMSAQGDESWVSVGFANPNGVATAAAVLHLVRIGEGASIDKPWEVVGSQDTTLTLTTPAYGATVRSPIIVGGSLTGVDESLHVQIRVGGQDRPVGEVTGIPAGGTASPWTTTVPFTVACPATLTIAVSTGGHTADVERFAVTGARC